MSGKSKDEVAQEALQRTYRSPLATTLKWVKATRPRRYALILKDLAGSDDPFLLIVFKRHRPAEVTRARREFKDAYGKNPEVVEGTVTLDGTTLVFEVPSGASIPNRLDRRMREALSDAAGRRYKVEFKTVASLTEADESDEDESEADESDTEGSPVGP